MRLHIDDTYLIFEHGYILRNLSNVTADFSEWLNVITIYKR